MAARRRAPARRSAAGATGPFSARRTRRPSAGARVVRPAAGKDERRDAARCPRPALRTPTRPDPGRQDAEALWAQRAGLRIVSERNVWSRAADSVSNLSEAELVVGEVAASVVTAEQSVAYADQSASEFEIVVSRTTHAEALYAARRREEAEPAFAD